MPLHKSPVGSEVKVLSLRFNEKSRRRIFDLGIIPSTKIKVLQKSPCGNPIAYSIRGTVIALRNEDAEKIIVESI